MISLGEKSKLWTWAEQHMFRVETDIYPMWEIIWFLHDKHEMVKLRFMGHDNGGDIVILSCPGGYGAKEDDWSGCGVGYAHSAEELSKFYDLFELRGVNEKVYR